MCEKGSWVEWQSKCSSLCSTTGGLSPSSITCPDLISVSSSSSSVPVCCSHLRVPSSRHFLLMFIPLWPSFAFWCRPRVWVCSWNLLPPTYFTCKSKQRPISRPDRQVLFKTCAPSGCGKSTTSKHFRSRPTNLFHSPNPAQLQR